MAVISFSRQPEHIWCVAGWAFRQVLEDVKAHTQDPELRERLDAASETKYLLVEHLTPESAHQTTEAIREVVQGILSGEVRSSIFDQPDTPQEVLDQYQEGLSMLLKAIPERVSK